MKTFLTCQGVKYRIVFIALARCAGEVEIRKVVRRNSGQVQLRQQPAPRLVRRRRDKVVPHGYEDLEVASAQRALASYAAPTTDRMPRHGRIEAVVREGSTSSCCGSPGLSVGIQNPYVSIFWSFFLIQKCRLDSVPLK